MKHLSALAVMFCVLFNVIGYTGNFETVSAVPVSNAGEESQKNTEEKIPDDNESNEVLSSPVENEKTPTQNIGDDGDRDDANGFFSNYIKPLFIAVALIFAGVLVFFLIKIRRKQNHGDDLNKPKPERVKQKISNTNARFLVGNFQNIGQRDEQQDAFCVSDIDDKDCLRSKGLMAVVADGMGGLESGAIISKLVVETFIKNYKKLTELEPEKFLYDTAEKAENIVFDYRKKNNINGGSTLVAVIIKAGELYTLSVGDSRIYLFRDGKLEKLNHEHTFGAYLKERARHDEVDELEPYINPKRDALTAYIGMGSFLKVDRLQHFQLFPHDKILLCSDGVFNALSDEAIIATLRNDALTAAEKMEQVILAQDMPTQDNFTGIILEYVE